MLPDWVLPVNQEALVVDQNIGHHQNRRMQKGDTFGRTRGALWTGMDAGGHDRLLKRAARR